METRIAIAEEAVPQPLKATLFRIVQEAFNNVARHSGAGRCCWSWRPARGRSRSSVEDNGSGFVEGTTGSTGGTGMGLANMRERALLSGGTFDLRTKPGEGTRLSFAWPTAGA